MTEPRGWRRLTCVEFFKRLGLPRSKHSLLRRYFCTLRRRGLGQMSALIATSRALKYTLTEITNALGRNYRRVWERWSNVQKKFRLDDVIDLLEFLNDPKAWPEGRRSKPTPQERPFDRPGVHLAPASSGRPVRRSGQILFDHDSQRAARGRRESSKGHADRSPPEQSTDCAG